jgi:uridine phosphorylase
MKITQPNIQIKASSIPKYFLLPGDPARATMIATTYLKSSRLLSSYREFIVYAGYYKDIYIGVCSTGIGSPSTAMATEELINLGARTLIRVGTCGGALKKEITAGSIIIPTASIREEGTTNEYIPASFPAIADRFVVQALQDAANRYTYRNFVGINRTHDGYYGQAENIKRWGSIYKDPRMKSWEYPLLSSEMECAPLFLIGLLRGVSTGAVLAVNSYPEDLRAIVTGKQKFSTPNSKIYTPEAKKSVERAISTALEAIVLLEQRKEVRKYD